MINENLENQRDNPSKFNQKEFEEYILSRSADHWSILPDRIINDAIRIQIGRDPISERLSWIINSSLEGLGYELTNNGWYNPNFG